MRTVGAPASQAMASCWPCLMRRSLLQADVSSSSLVAAVFAVVSKGSAQDSQVFAVARAMCALLIVILDGSDPVHALDLEENKPAIIFVAA